MRTRSIWGPLVVGVVACGGAAAPMIASAPEKPAQNAIASSSSVSPSSSASDSDSDSDAASASASAPVVPATPEVLLTTHGDLDGKGDAPITLTSDGFVHLRDLQVQVELERNEFLWSKRAALAVVEIDKKKGVRGVLFTEATAESEDPPNRYRLVLAYDGALHVAYDKILGAYNVTPLEFPGDGTAHYREDPWTACDRAKPSKKVVQHDVTLALDKKKMLVEKSRKPSGVAAKCDQLSG
jgi:hypothetical protein